MGRYVVVLHICIPKPRQCLFPLLFCWLLIGEEHRPQGTGEQAGGWARDLFVRAEISSRHRAAGKFPRGGFQPLPYSHSLRRYPPFSPGQRRPVTSHELGEAREGRKIPNQDGGGSPISVIIAGFPGQDVGYPCQPCSRSAARSGLASLVLPFLFFLSLRGPLFLPPIRALS